MLYITIAILLSILFIYMYTGVSILESLSLGFIFLLGISGSVPFFLNEYLNIPYLKTPIYIFILLIILCLLVIRKNRFLDLVKDVSKIKKYQVISFFSLVTLCFVWGINTPVRGWDAYSMYDSRAKMFNSGVKMSEMGELTKYDDKNNLYYFSYPPMTSSIHAVLYSVGFKSPMFIYIFLFLSIVVLIQQSIKDTKIGKLFKWAVLGAACFNPLIFDQITIAYSNLPAVSFQIASIFLVFKFVDNKRLKNIVIAGLFLGLSNWTRSLEPTFIAVIVGIVYLLLVNKNIGIFKKTFTLILCSLLAILPKIMWSNFVLKYVGVTGATMPTLFELIQNLINSLYISNIISVIFFIYQSLFPTKIYLVLFAIILLMMLVTRHFVENAKFIFLGIVILTIFLIMTSGTLYFSQVFEWWNEISGSFLRSNLILIPLIVLFAGFFVDEFENKNSGKYKRAK